MIRQIVRPRSCFVLVAFAVCAQTTKSPRFEVASIKPSAPGGSPHGQPAGMAGGERCTPLFGAPSSSLQYSLFNCTVRELVGRAWNLQAFEFSVPADPAWLSSARYDITAKAAVSANALQHAQMLQPLPEDRFRLKWHREKREEPVYYLTIAKRGAKLTPTKPGSCTPWDHKGPPPPPYPDKPPTCDYVLFPRIPDSPGIGMEGIGVSMTSFAEHLTGMFGRPVIDRTGIATLFDVHIKFTRESAGAFANRSDAPVAIAPEPSGLPSIFTAIRSLGLNIEAGKGPVDVFVIDSAQRPSAN